MLTSIAVILLLGISIGWIFSKLRLPSLLGMVIVGIILSPHALDLIDESILMISGELRQIALVIILTRAGLSLNVVDLKKVGRPAILMCFVPACVEMLGTVIFAPMLLGVSVLEAAIIGSVIAAVSPAVVVPRMIRLIDEGYGKNKSIPQLILAGASVDDVFVIVVFTAFTALAATGEISISSFVQIPISIILGVILGAGNIPAGMFPVYTAEYDVLTKLTGFALTRGMLCAMRRKELVSVSEICEGKRRIAVLENVVNPTNVGAIFRSAAALNMDGVLLTGNCSDPLYRRAIRVSMGTVFQIPWTIIPQKIWEEQGVDMLHSFGFKTAAMALCDESISIDDKNLLSEEKIAVILGTEGDGLATSTIHDSDYTVCIPMAHGVDSLNVAAASAVAFWELGNK